MRYLGLLLICLPLMLPAAVEEAQSSASTATATRLAVTVIRERARELTVAGRAVLASHLETLAQALAVGQVTLADATRVAQIALAGQGPEIELTVPAPAPVSAVPAPPQVLTPPVTAKDVTAILDGQTPPKLETPAPPAAAPPATASSAAPVIAATIVLAVSRGSDGKTQLVMVGVGTKESVAVGQRFELRRDDKLLAVATVSQARESMAVCVVIPGTGAGADVEIKEGDAAVPVAP